MKNIFIYATCQGNAIERLLRDDASFDEQFYIKDIVRNYAHIKENKPLIDNEYFMQCIKDCDVFIYQPLDDFYGKHSTDNILPILKPSCIRISIPYITNTSIWPIFEAMKGDMGNEWKDAESRIIHNTYPISKLLDKGKSPVEILKMFDNNDIDWLFKERHDIEMELLGDREKNTVIKVRDYIEQNLSTKRMFVYPSHLSADLVVYITNQICNILGIEERGYVYDENCFFPPTSMRAMPTCSAKYFKMAFVSKEEMTLADKYYKNIIMKYLRRKRK